MEESQGRGDLIKEYNLIKNSIEKAILSGTHFIFNCMDGGKVPSFNHSAKEYGYWPSAEMAEFLLTNRITPTTCNVKVEEIIDFLVDEFKVIDSETGAWLATKNDVPYYSAATTGHCIYVLKLYYNSFLSDDRKNQIRNIIDSGMRYLISKQKTSGCWIPETDGGDIEDGMNYGDFFYSYNAYWGIKDVVSYCFDDTAHLNAARERVKNYFISYARHLIKVYNDEQNDDSKLILLSNVSKVLQVLYDFNDVDSKMLDVLQSAATECFEVAEKRQFVHTTVLVQKMPNSVPKNFHNNTPFDAFFSQLNQKESANRLIRIVEWYLKKQDIAQHCWYLDGNRNLHSDQNTWTTTEALLVLSNAYNLLTEEFYLRELQKAECQEEKCSQCRAEKEEKCDKCKTEHKLETRQRKNSLIISSIIAILISLVSIILFIVIVTTQPLTNGMEVAVNIFFVPLALSILVEIAKWVWAFIKTRRQKDESNIEKK